MQSSIHGHSNGNGNSGAASASASEGHGVSSNGSSVRWWDDPDLQDNLVALISFDPVTLKACGSILTPEDFRPQKGDKQGRFRWLVAERALAFWGKYSEPLGKFLRSDLLEYADQLGFGSSQVNDLAAYIQSLKKLKPVTPDAIVEKVIRFKTDTLRAGAIEELIELQASGRLDDEKWAEITSKASVIRNGFHPTINYSQTVEDRIDRRSRYPRRIPYTFIDPLDIIIKTVGPGELGLCIAPYKRGKSLFLEWMAVALARQAYPPLYVTLEDPVSVVEDRLDALATHIPIKSLSQYPKVLRKRFSRFKSMIRSEIQIMDGTEGGVTIDAVEKRYLELRDRGFYAKAVLIDYDEELEAVRQFKDKRHETDDNYRKFRRFLAKYNLIGWMAAQTQRDTRHLKILTGDKVAEDIGKMKKVACGITMGKGEWTDDSIFLWVAAHKNDRMDIGCEIVPDLKRMMIYDEEATRRAAKKHSSDEED